MASVTSSQSRPSRARSYTTTTGLLPLSVAPPAASSVLIPWRSHVLDKDRPHLRFVFLNPLAFPFAKDGDIVRISQPPESFMGADNRSEASKKMAEEGFFFEFNLEALKDLKTDKDRANLTVSIIDSALKTFPFRGNQRVKLEVVNRSDVTADFVELFFRDQYVGRADMWRLGVSWEGKCIQVNQSIRLAGSIDKLGKAVGGVVAEVKNIYINSKKVPAAYFTARTKTIFRSSSAKSYLAIQVCREMYEFDEDGERYYEKALHGFLPRLFERWTKAKSNHIVSIILFSRVCYDQSELAHVEGPLNHDQDFGTYKDFFKVCVDSETPSDFVSIVSKLKEELANFQKAVLLDHNHIPGKEALILGTLSYAHHGNILEMINLAINPYDQHYVDRDFVRTGLNLTVITPGTGHFKVDKHLLRLTTDRCTDHGLSVDLVCLNKMPLHSVPLFSFYSSKPELGGEGRKTEGKTAREDYMTKDPLYFDSPTVQGGMEEMDLFYSVAFWVYCSFWSRSKDKHKLPGMFIPRVKMPQVQNLGVLNHDLTTIIIPHLDEDLILHDVGASAISLVNTSSSASTDSTSAPLDLVPVTDAQRRIAQQAFDHDVFAPSAPVEPVGSFAVGTMDSSARRVAVHSPTSSNSMSAVASNHSPTNLNTSSYRTSGLLASSYNSLSGNLHTPQLSSSLGQHSHVASPSPPSSGFASNTATSPAAFPKMPIQQVHGSTLTATATAARAFYPAQALVGRRKSTLSVKAPSRSASQASFASRSTVVRSPNAIGTHTPSRPASVISETLSPSVVQIQPSSASQTSRRSKLPVEKGLKSWWPWGTKTEATAEETGIVVSAEPPTPAAQYQSSISSTRPLLSPSPIIASTPRTSPLSIPSNPLPITAAGAHQPEDLQPRNSLASRSIMQQEGGRRGTPGSYGEQNMKDGAGKATERQWIVNPCNPSEIQLANQNATHRWQHILPRGSMAHQVKWKSLVTPGCLPITTDYMPSEAELQKNYSERESAFPMEEFHESPFIRNPASGTVEKQAIVREMALQRLAQGFQVVVSTGTPASPPSARLTKNSKGQKAARSAPLPGGASEALRQKKGAIFLSLSNLIHRLEYTERDDSIRIRQYSRRLTYSTEPISYQCVIWPVLASKFSKVEATFTFPSQKLDKFNWNKVDNLVTGDQESLDKTLTYWRARFIVIPSEIPPDPSTHRKAKEEFKEEEILLTGADLLAGLMTKARWIRPSEANDPPPPVRLLRTTLDPSTCVLDEVLMNELSALQNSRGTSKSRLVFAKTSVEEVVKIMQQKEGGLAIGDTPWGHRVWPDAFTGETLVSWLCETFSDIKTREDATREGQKFFEGGMFRHVHELHQFNDGNYIYQLKPPYGTPKESRLRSFLPRTSSSAVPKSASEVKKDAARSRLTACMSREMLIDLDPTKKSDRSEVAFLHYDAIHNPQNGFHLEFSWIGITAQLVEELRQNWSKQIERYGLRMVEAPSDPISEITSRSAFRSCLAIPLALPPPTSEEFDPQPNKDLLPSNQYFETFLLRKRLFALDIQSDDHFNNTVDVQYRREVPFHYSQYVHRTGLAFVQCLPDGRGFLWLDNRLYTEKKESKNVSDFKPIKERMERLRSEFRAFCASKEELAAVWEEAKREREREWAEQGQDFAVATRKIAASDDWSKLKSTLSTKRGEKAAPAPYFGSPDDVELR